jgi:hypothetical protein
VFQLITALTDGVSFDYQSSTGPGTAGGLVGYLLFTLIALRPVFAKAGYNGWSAIVPIYNIYVMVKMAGYHGATVILYVLPVIGWIFSIVVAVRIGKNFGKGGGFSFFLLWLLPFIGYCIVGYGSAIYVGPARVKN